MTFIGSFALLLSFVGIIATIICMLLGRGLLKKGLAERAESLFYAGAMASYLVAIALTLCCGLLVYGFMSGDTSLYYVVENQSDDSSALGWLYRLSGLWAGREGSLLFWAWLISIFNAIIARRVSRDGLELDAMALLVSQIVLGAFVGVMIFSTENMPFEAMDPQYLNDDGTLIGAATMWGMNPLLEHWAMSIHPPTLFIGYAGMTLPFAYALAAVIANDPSSAWVKRARGCTLFAWLFLGLGIGLGAVWAYVVLGWGGYWGWDPVENASLLPWLVGLALLHSFKVYRKRGTFKRWSVFCACLTFTFVILGTFISRSGLVSSVHSFNGDTVSTVLFLMLIILSLVAGIIGVFVRRTSFAPVANIPETESLMSKDIAFYVNNLVMVLCAVLLAYLTLASAFPSFMPLGGTSVSTGTYNTIARPIVMLYCLLMAVCPLLSWCKTDKAIFLKTIKIPAIASVVVFAVLLVVFIIVLVPNYNASIALGGSAAEAFTDYGPKAYYFALAIFGLAVASILVCNTMVMLKNSKTLAGIGAAISHAAIAIILVGLVGSSMFVYEDSAYITYDKETSVAENDMVVRDYTLVYTGKNIEELANGDDVMYTVYFDVYKGDRFIGSIDPSIEVVESTMQQKLIAAVKTFPLEDLFVVFQGLSAEGQLIMDVRINPLIMFVWIGFGVLMVGIAMAFCGRKQRSTLDKTSSHNSPSRKAAL